MYEILNAFRLLNKHFNQPLRFVNMMDTKLKKVSKSSMEQIILWILKYLNTRENDLKGLALKIGKDFSTFTATKLNGTAVFGEVPKLKFICKEIWIELFGKPIDTLQTNNYGTYILHDNDFNWFRQISTTPKNNFLTSCFVFLESFFGGVLSGLGLVGKVSCEVIKFDASLLKSDGSNESKYFYPGRRRVLFHMILDRFQPSSTSLQ